MQKVKLHDICTLERGSSPRPIQDYITTAKDGVNWIKIGDTNPNEKYVNKTAEKITKEGAKKSRKVEIGDFILSNSMSLGHPFIMNINGYIHDGWFVLRPDYKKVDRDFLYYSLLSDYVQTQFKGTCTGSVVKNIRSELVNDLDIFLPDITEQKRIAKVLSSIDRKISVNREINRNLEELAKQIYDYWFVQFDFPNEDGTPYKSSGGKMVYNEFLKREIPENWNCTELQNLCDINRGASPRPIDDFMDPSKAGIPWIKISDATEDIESPYLLTIKDCIIPEGKNKSVSVKPDTLIVSNSATPGIPKFVEIDACVHDGWLILTNYEQYYKYYLFYVIKMVRYNLLHLASGSIFKNLKTDYLKTLPTLNPQIKTLKKFDEKIKRIMKEILITEKEIKELVKLRDNLLPLLMNGQITLNSCLSAD